VDAAVATAERLAGGSLVTDGLSKPLHGAEGRQDIVDRLVQAGPGSHGIAFVRTYDEHGRLDPTGQVYNVLHDPRLNSVVFLDARSGRLASAPDSADYRFMVVRGGDSVATGHDPRALLDDVSGARLDAALDAASESRGGSKVFDGHALSGIVSAFTGGWRRQPHLTFSGVDHEGVAHEFSAKDVRIKPIEHGGFIMGASFHRDGPSTDIAREVATPRADDPWGANRKQRSAFYVETDGDRHEFTVHLRDGRELAVAPEVTAKLLAGSGMLRLGKHGPASLTVFTPSVGTHDFHTALRSEGAVARMHAVKTSRPAPVSAHLLEPIPDLGSVPTLADRLWYRLFSHGATKETVGLAKSTTEEAAEEIKAVEGEAAAGKFRTGLQRAVELLERDGVLNPYLRKAGDPVTAGLMLSHLLDGMARAWAQGGNAAAAAAAQMEMRMIGIELPPPGSVSSVSSAGEGRGTDEQ